ncbi:MAG: 23S rRNA (pseudouridine(1915)-N(3))-methyltransferase RlmH [Bacteriovoracaceae bacterium]|nr:23S rRNA (pseudouridine(1915)-N(3))-methyltransferase RlmH [Bacteriovoracaceae bacterium]
MSELYIIAIGRLKDQNLSALEVDYLKRISLPKIHIIELKAISNNKEAEAELVIKKIKDITKGNTPYIVTLEEVGRTYDSIEFSQWFYELTEKSNSCLFFILGGALGHGKKVLDMAHSRLSLSKLTFPHQLARIILVEQLYRAYSIRQLHPYHK